MPTFYSIWEIQTLKPFNGYSCEYSDSFRLKNISTGLFLSVSKSNKAPFDLELNPSGNLKRS